MSRFRWALACALVAAAVGVRWAAAEEAAKTEDAKQADAKQADKAKPSEESATTLADAERRIQQMLDRRLKTPLSFVEAPLNQIAHQLSEEYGLPIVFDVKALEAAGLSADLGVSIDLSNVTLRSALELMLRQVEGLTFIVDNEVLQLTTKDEANRRLQVVVYRVEDLVRADGGGLPASPEAYDFDSLIEILTSSVARDSWQENGSGEGEVHPYAPGMLVVSQTTAIHSQIERVLSDMRHVKGDIEADAPASSVGEARPITRGIPVEGEALGSSDANREMVRNAIVQSVDWGDQKGDSADHFLYVLPGRIIVRHLPHVVRQVEHVMDEMGAKADAKGQTGQFVGGGRGGGF